MFLSHASLITGARVSRVGNGARLEKEKTVDREGPRMGDTTKGDEFTHSGRWLAFSKSSRRSYSCPIWLYNIARGDRNNKVPLTFPRTPPDCTE